MNIRDYLKEHKVQTVDIFKDVSKLMEQYRVEIDQFKSLELINKVCSTLKREHNNGLANMIQIIDNIDINLLSRQLPPKFRK